jgi:deazaflavin-dependent oxidoreductase (nitroreductase family)
VGTSVADPTCDDAAMSPRPGRRIAGFNRRFTNHVALPLARRLPGFGVVLHTGRRSEREYRTPVNIFAGRGGFVVALTYGADADWVRNVVAAGGCDVITRGRRLRLTDPEIFHDESRRAVSAIVRPMLRFLDVTDFMRLIPRSQAEG